MRQQIKNGTCLEKTLATLVNEIILKKTEQKINECMIGNSGNDKKAAIDITKVWN